MKNAIIFSIALLLVMMQACIPSLHPLYTEKDLVFDRELLGHWVDEDGEITWHFEERGHNAYTLSLKEKDKDAKLVAHLFRLEEALFIDFYPLENPSVPSFYQMHLFPTHTFGKISFRDNRFMLQMLDPLWLDKLRKEGELKLSYILSGDDMMMLTAPTEELQAFVLANLDNQEAFSDPVEFSRKSD